MAKIFPKSQHFVSLRDGTSIGIVVCAGVTTSSDYVVIGAATDAAILNTTRTLADPTFYLAGNKDSIFNIDGGVVDREYVIVSRHNTVNFVKSD